MTSEMSPDAHAVHHLAQPEGHIARIVLRDLITPVLLRQRDPASVTFLAELMDLDPSSSEFSRYFTAPTNTPSISDVHVERALDLIRHRYGEPALSVAVVARILRLSPCRLAHLIRQRTGSTFGQLLISHRVGKAADLLRASNLSVKEIAAVVGYSHTAGLDRQFKRRTGMTPCVYRARTAAGNRIGQPSARLARE
jgi:AraC-like DNA-binding protein